MILSVRVIRKPKRVRQCCECGRDIEGVTIRYYGMPDVGDKPYCLYVHPGCVHPGHARSDERIAAAVNTAMNLSWGKLSHTLFVLDGAAKETKNVN